MQNRQQRKATRSLLPVFVVGAVVLGCARPAEAADESFAPESPIKGLHEVPHDRVHLRDGFWGQRQKTHHEVTIPHALDCLEADGHVTNFDMAAGRFDGPLRGHHAFDSDLHKALEGALYCLQHRDDPQLRRRVNDILDRIVAAQRNRARRRFRNSIRNGRMQDRKPLVEQHEAIGHAVRAGYIYSAMADIARFMDAPQYERAVERIWQDVVFRKMYVTGSVGTAQYHEGGFGDP